MKWTWVKLGKYRRIKPNWSASIGERGNEAARGKKTDYDVAKARVSSSDSIVTRIELQFTAALRDSIDLTLLSRMDVIR